MSTPSTQAASIVTLPATEALQQQEIASPTSPVVEAFTPKKITLNSAEVISNAATQPTKPPLPCDVATALIDEPQVELRWLHELERR